ncbi:MAG: PAS domain S-box protein [Candidatus Rokubacteria bacterium]|nr:PAS domain S-box protein [Candidatus Rokubacteria bacterium]
MVFGAAAVWLMWARIELGEGVYIDARNVPIALVALFEGPVAALVSVAIAIAYRASRGGSGAAAGIGGLLAVAFVATATHVWARRNGGVRWPHATVLGAGVFVMTFLSFAVLGAQQLRKFTTQWTAYFAVYAIGIALLAQLFRDVGDRARLAVERARFRAIIDEATDAIRIVDADTMRLVDANVADARLLGRDRAELAGRDVRELWPGDPALRADHETLAAEVRARGFARRFGVPYRTATGATVHMDVTHRMVDHGGRRYEIVVARDANERETLEAARREAAELRAINLLAGTTAHEINNPLAVVVGALALLGRTLTASGREKDLLDRALAASERIRDIVRQLTMIRRVETEQAGPNLPPILNLKASTAAPPVEPTGDDSWTRSSTSSPS